MIKEINSEKMSLQEVFQDCREFLKEDRLNRVVIKGSNDTFGALRATPKGNIVAKFAKVDENGQAIYPPDVLMDRTEADDRPWRIVYSISGDPEENTNDSRFKMLCDLFRPRMG